MYRGFTPGPLPRQHAASKTLQLQLHCWDRNPQKGSTSSALIVRFRNFHAAFRPKLFTENAGLQNNSNLPVQCRTKCFFRLDFSNSAYEQYACAQNTPKLLLLQREEIQRVKPR